MSGASGGLQQVQHPEPCRGVTDWNSSQLMKSVNKTGYFPGLDIMKPDGFLTDPGFEIRNRTDFFKPDSGLDSGSVRPSEVPDSNVSLEIMFYRY